MHPYGGTPHCPRCSKAVYCRITTAMGPGRKLYHKPCLACADCNKRLDSFSLLEHDEQVRHPYSSPKNCHRKLFGTRDLRQANLPHRDDLRPLSPTRTGSIPAPLSPTRTGSAFPPVPITPPRSSASPPPLPNRRPFHAASVGRTYTGNGGTTSLLRPTHTLSPTRAAFAMDGGDFDPLPEEPDAEDEEAEVERELAEVVATARNELIFPLGTPTHVGRAGNGMPRTVQLSPERSGSPTRGAEPSTASSSDDAPESMRTTIPVLRPATVGRRMAVPLVPTATGTRYGAGLTSTPTGTRYGGAQTSTPTGGKQWGGGTPQCPRCSKSVYFAEQVKAVGKTWHKTCLRCVECNTSLDSSRLTEKDGEPHCRSCYSKLHGPRGNGYALLGKAGG
ncbi:hypothetical protein OF83DRAFT_1064538 [Amylostereum chailletii]|nr:hypothetical protein OF83DRAFT_1064538 [Amylostereum chailletii]